MNLLLLLIVAGTTILLMNSCGPSIPKKATAVRNFDADKYLGKWYEIARMDFRQERNLNNVTAVYSQKKNGAIKVKTAASTIKLINGKM